MGDLHGWRIFVTIACDHFKTEALAFDGDFFTEFT
jgi:hypothetical protein